MIVTCEVSKHLIVSLSEEFSTKIALALVSFKAAISRQGDWVIVGGWVFDPDPPFFPFWVLDSVDFDDLDLEDVGLGNGNDNDNGNVNELFYLLLDLSFADFTAFPSPPLPPPFPFGVLLPSTPALADLLSSALAPFSLFASWV